MICRWKQLDITKVQRVASSLGTIESQMPLIIAIRRGAGVERGLKLFELGCRALHSQVVIGIYSAAVRPNELQVDYPE